MAENTIDRLQIEVQAKATQAQKSLNQLAASLTNVSTALKGIGNRTTQLDDTFKAIQKFNRLDPNRMARSAVQISNLSTAMQRMNNVNVKSSGVNTLVNSLARLTKVDTSSFDARKIADIANSIQALGTMPDVSSSINRMVNSFTRLALAGDSVQTTAQNLPAFSKALSSAVSELASAGMVSDNTTKLVTSIAQLAQSGDKTAVTAQNLGQLSTATMDFFNKMAAAPEVSDNTVRLAEAFATLAASGYKAGSVSKDITDLGNSASTLKDKLKGVASAANSFVKAIQSIIGVGKQATTVIGKLFRAITGFGGSASTLTSDLGRLLGVMIGFKGVRAVFDGIKESLDLGSRVVELENVVNTSFGNLKKNFTDLSDAVYAFAEKTKTQFGVGEVAARQYSGILMSMFNSSGFDSSDTMHKQAAQMSLDLTTLAGR